MSAVNIVRAVEADCDLILQMIQGLAEYEKLSHACTATVEELRLTLFGARPAADVLLAYQGDVCAGFALFFPNYSTFLAKPGIYLEDLFVKPEFRGRGIGIALLGAIARTAEERGCGRVEWSVLDWNQPSIEFYKKLGAVAMDEWSIYRLTGEALRRLAAD